MEEKDEYYKIKKGYFIDSLLGNGFNNCFF